MNTAITIVDRGRGPQLSTSRITVQDVVPYIQQGFTDPQVFEIMPALTLAELRVLQQYVRDHYTEVMEQDLRIRQRRESQKNPPEVEEILRRGKERMAALREEFRQIRERERNGDHVAG